LSSPSTHEPSKNGDTATLGFDVDETVCSASKAIIDEVHKVTNSMGASDSLGMATCLATVGECLLKCRQARDANMRLEEAVSIYRGVLGPYHVHVAHTLNSVAKALTKLGETRVSLLKFAEAARIYETCNATLHYDSIANAQSLASLLVDIGDIRKAEAMFEEVIAMKQTVYGETSVPVAKTINNYAILLAKHGRMEDALRHYDVARMTYMNAPPSVIVDQEFEIKCNYDVTLITLNIASIYSKKGDLDNALECYEKGVRGLEEYEDEMARIREMNGSREQSSTKGSSHKHLVAALGRIGSIKMKKGDHDGSLEAYMMLIEEVTDDSPLTSHVEKAKAHIKCATIFRKRGGDDNHTTAVNHLREALRMYKALYDPGHKDTTAIATTLKQWLAEDKARTQQG
jgi:tetratricopeptide (TPR) repeat protein